ncbi:MAG TPA: hypothetical protein VLU24_09120, partial [Mycobacterium sp.]|nr:hypothetical protein [Mycobacterium sp.]
PLSNTPTATATNTPSSCPGNLVQNGSFEITSGTNSIGDPIPTIWVVESGEAGATTAFQPPDGVRVGYIWGTGVGNTGLWTQQVSAVAGNVYAMTFYSGTHDPSVHPTIEIRFYNSSNVEIGTPAIHTITTDIDITGAVGGPYTLSATAPTGVSYLKVIFRDPSTTRAGAKGDSVCLLASTATPTTTPTATKTKTPTTTPTTKLALARAENVVTPTPSATVTPTPAPTAQFCTLTQAGWRTDRAGFLARNPALLPVTLGGDGRSTTLRAPRALFAYLPKRGAPAALLPGDRVFSRADDIVYDGGGILSGETVALTLNIYASDSGTAFDGLGNLTLPPQPFCTQRLGAGVDGKFGTADDQLAADSAVTGPWVLPNVVANGRATVNDLASAANRLLQGKPESAAVLDVTNSVITVNRAFDNCARIVDCR